MHKDKLGEYRVVTSSGYEIYTLTLDFLAKHPFDLAAAPDAFPEDIYNTAMETLFASRTILTATDWAKSSNSKMHRPPDGNDHEAIRRTVFATRNVADDVLASSVFAPSQDVIILLDHVPSVRFGCVSGKFERIVAVAGVVAATGIFGVALDHYLTRPNFSTNCALNITSPKALPTHFATQLSMKNAMLFDPENKACVVLRQRLLELAGYYQGPIDGVYGDIMIGAEIAFATKHMLAPEKLDTLYTRLSDTL
nr:hypothetical protein [uncultured Shimia sp.]